MPELELLLREQIDKITALDFTGEHRAGDIRKTWARANEEVDYRGG
jgi:hypothetical protein